MLEAMARKTRLIDCDPRWGVDGGARHVDRYITFDCPEGHDGCRHVIPLTPALDGAPQTSPQRNGAQWARTGDTFETLTLTPSIRRIPNDAEDCAFHGFITAGQITFCGDSRAGTRVFGDTPPMTKPDDTTADPNRLTFNDSSNVIGATFDPKTGAVDVEFKDKRRYRYANFTPELLAEWKSAPSAGKWFSQRLKADPKSFPVVPLNADGSVATVPSPAAASDTSPTPATATAASPNVTPTSDPQLRVDYAKSSSDDQSRARVAYDAYAENSNGLTFDGRAMPTFDKLNNAVRSHWTAASQAIATMYRAQLEDLDRKHKSANEQLDELGRDLDNLAARNSRAPGAADLQALRDENQKMKADPAINRAVMLESEVDKLRLDLAAAQKKAREDAKMIDALKSDNPGTAAVIAREQAQVALRAGVRVLTTPPVRTVTMPPTGPSSDATAVPSDATQSPGGSTPGTGG